MSHYIYNLNRPPLVIQFGNQSWKIVGAFRWAFFVDWEKEDEDRAVFSISPDKSSSTLGYVKQQQVSGWMSDTYLKK